MRVQQCDFYVLGNNFILLKILFVAEKKLLDMIRRIFLFTHRALESLYLELSPVCPSHAYTGRGSFILKVLSAFRQTGTPKLLCRKHIGSQLKFPLGPVLWMNSRTYRYDLMQLGSKGFDHGRHGHVVYRESKQNPNATLFCLVGLFVFREECENGVCSNTRFSPWKFTYLPSCASGSSLRKGIFNKHYLVLTYTALLLFK